MPTAGLRVALGPVLCLACGVAFAQVGGSIAFLSDYRYRGVSLSDDRPTFRLGLGYDDPSGWFAGASLAGVSLGPYARRQVQVLGYAGYAGRVSDRIGWEAGATGVHFGADSYDDYGEVFTGLNGERWSMRLHYSPDYFGSGVRTVYGEFNVGLPLSQLIRVTAHAGALQRVGGVRAQGMGLNLDASLGLAIARDAWEVRLEWVGGERSAIYPTLYGRESSGALVLTAAISF
ncbi:TorF family putative porin [Variovorax ureilyticus]|uniref:TorF family putative porin n=1 Tax=Variovorax ureilyticus TaxID=1836198 RepID=UPI003D677E1A